jgi:hypothetical protein
MLPDDTDADASTDELVDKTGAASVNGNGHDTAPPTEADIVAAVGQIINADDEATNIRFAVGDLLLRLCGETGPAGAHNASHGILNRIAKAIKDAYGERAKAKGIGFEFLRQLRRMAQVFPPGTHVPGLSWYIHRAAGDPVTLTKAIAKAKRLNLTLTVKNVWGLGQDDDDDDDDDAKPEWVTVLANALRAVADVAERMDWLRDFLRQDGAKLTDADREMIDDDIAEVTNHAEMIVLTAYEIADYLDPALLNEAAE